MSFRLRNDARHWFRHIRGNGFSIDFDSYYFCFMAGIASGQKEDMKASDTTEFISYFPERYKSKSKLMIALFLKKELKLMGVEIQEKKSVHAVISPLIDPESPSNLSETGFREFNKYAHGGFEAILDWFDDEPRTLDTFLRNYKRKIDDALA